MSAVDHHNGDGFVPTHTGLLFMPGGVAPDDAATNQRPQQDLRPLPSQETLAARPSTSHELSDSSLSKHKKNSYIGENSSNANGNNANRDLEKQESGKQDEDGSSKDVKKEEEKDPNLIEWDGDDDKVRLFKLFLDISS